MKSPGTKNAKHFHNSPQQTTQDMIQLYDTRMTNLLSSVGNILKHSKKEDTTELPKFLGGDSQWPKWYQLLRAYLQARGWLTTFDHPIGPGTLQTPTTEFDTDINSLIYQKLQAKCFEGTASTYVRMAAEFDGHGAGAHLKKRYNNSSPQQLESYILLAKNHRHTSGTSMPLHIDQYEAILGYMPDCGKIPTTRNALTGSSQPSRKTSMPLPKQCVSLRKYKALLIGEDGSTLQSHMLCPLPSFPNSRTPNRQQPQETHTTQHQYSSRKVCSSS